MVTLQLQVVIYTFFRQTGTTLICQPTYDRCIADVACHRCIADIACWYSMSINLGILFMAHIICSTNSKDLSPIIDHKYCVEPHTGAIRWVCIHVGGRSPRTNLVQSVYYWFKTTPADYYVQCNISVYIGNIPLLCVIIITAVVFVEI